MIRPFLCACAAFMLPAQSLAAQSVAESIAADLPGLLETYRDLHANPELAFEEVRSAAIMAAAARKAGFEVTEKVGKTGVVAVMRNGPGPTVLIRADMDGLPVTEQTGLDYASKRRAVSAAGVESGVMHACGHDTHMTAWIATARLMAERRAQWSGTLVMIGQPAEEIGLGARAMLADGLYSRFPKPDYALAMHDSPEIAAGNISVSQGWALANVDSVDIEVRGVGGHGAYPSFAKDPIVLAAAIVMRLQTIVSRENNPLDPAVVTVGSFHAGTKHNIIPAAASLQLTVRSYSDETRALLLGAIARIAKGEALAAGVPDDRMPLVTVKQPYTRSTYNSPALVQGFVTDLRQKMGAERVSEAPPAMAGEDFGEYRRADEKAVQSLIFWVGGVARADLEEAAQSGKALPSLHSSFWAPQAEEVVAAGAEAMTHTALRLMAKSQ